MFCKQYRPWIYDHSIFGVWCTCLYTSLFRSYSVCVCVSSALETMPFTYLTLFSFLSYACKCACFCLKFEWIDHIFNGCLNTTNIVWSFLILLHKWSFYWKYSCMCTDEEEEKNAKIKSYGNKKPWNFNTRIHFIHLKRWTAYSTLVNFKRHMYESYLRVGNASGCSVNKINCAPIHNIFFSIPCTILFWFHVFNGM